MYIIIIKYCYVVYTSYVTKNLMNFYRVNIKIWDLRFETFAVSRKRVYKSLFWFSQALSSDEGTFAYKILSKLEKILVILFFCRRLWQICLYSKLSMASQQVF